MVKGITRQVVVVKAPDQKLFDQAIFLVRDDALAQGGITEEILLKEAKIACRSQVSSKSLIKNLLWSAGGALITGFLWLLTIVVI